jgi:hypothetical protein
VINKMAINLVAEIMGWQEDGSATATREYAWLRLMSSIKFDDYSDFRAGVRFIESLAIWLKQFKPEDRGTAYNFVKHRLIYVSSVELRQLIRAFVPEVVTPNLRACVSADSEIRPYEVWAQSATTSAFKCRLRKTLFVGMSDGSRIDILRRANAGRLSTEQIVPVINIDRDKWLDLNEKLADDLNTEPGLSKFESVYLIDDFAASGTTFIRQINGKWKGKLKKFNKLVTRARERLNDQFPLAENYSLHIHHYVSSYQARQALEERLGDATENWSDRSYGSVAISEGLLLPSSAKLSDSEDAAVLALCDEYYDHALFERLQKHCEEAGQSDMKRGYADCALPVILDHNTPNNSISLLWAETDGNNGAHSMQPLFRRRDRHG